MLALKKHLALNTNTLPQSLQFVLDSETNILILIDSGCAKSLIPQSLTNGINRNFFTHKIKHLYHYCT